MNKVNKELQELKELVEGLLPPEDRVIPTGEGIMEQLSKASTLKYKTTSPLSKEVIDKFMADIIYRPK